MHNVEYAHVIITIYLIKYIQSFSYKLDKTHVYLESKTL